MVITQLIFSEAFVEDILNAAQLQNGFLSLTNNYFNPMEAFEFVLSVFQESIERRGVSLLFNVVTSLQIPNSRAFRDAEDEQLLLVKKERNSSD